METTSFRNNLQKKYIIAVNKSFTKRNDKKKTFKKIIFRRKLVSLEYITFLCTIFPLETNLSIQ